MRRGRPHGWLPAELLPCATQSREVQIIESELLDEMLQISLDPGEPWGDSNAQDKTTSYDLKSFGDILVLEDRAAEASTYKAHFIYFGTTIEQEILAAEYVALGTRHGVVPEAGTEWVFTLRSCSQVIFCEPFLGLSQSWTRSNINFKTHLNILHR